MNNYLKVLLLACSFAFFASVVSSFMRVEENSNLKPSQTESLMVGEKTTTKDIHTTARKPARKTTPNVIGSDLGQADTEVKSFIDKILNADTVEFNRHIPLTPEHVEELYNLLGNSDYSYRWGRIALLIATHDSTEIASVKLIDRVQNPSYMGDSGSLSDSLLLQHSGIMISLGLLGSRQAEEFLVDGYAAPENLNISKEY